MTSGRIVRFSSIQVCAGSPGGSCLVPAIGYRLATIGMSCSHLAGFAPGAAVK